MYINENVLYLTLDLDYHSASQSPQIHLFLARQSDIPHPQEKRNPMNKELIYQHTRYCGSLLTWQDLPFSSLIAFIFLLCKTSRRVNHKIKAQNGNGTLVICMHGSLPPPPPPPPPPTHTHTSVKSRMKP